LLVLASVDIFLYGEASMSNHEAPPLDQNHAESVTFGLTTDQKAALSLEAHICLALAINPAFQEEPHPAPEINELFAAEIGIDLEDEKEKLQLQEANKTVKFKKLVLFEMIEGGIKPTLTPEGYSALAREIAKSKKQLATNKDNSSHTE
jgi:hypothetical protein